MSDFLFSTRRAEPGVLRGHLERYLAPVTERVEEFHGAWGSLAVALAHHDRAVVVEDGHSISVLVGDPVVRIAPHAAGRAATGDLRAAVHRLLRAEEAVAWDERLDGQFAALVVDTAAGSGRVLTDLFAFVPVFAAEAGVGGEGGLVLGTHLDAVAWAAGRNRDVDPVSAADLVINLTVAFPHTVFRGVEQLWPGTERAFAAGGWSGPGRTYWQPAERSPYGSLDEAAEALRGGFAEDVRAACHGESLVGLLLSGGEDSRAVLGAVPEGTGVRAFVFGDRENREVRVARAVARAHGAELVMGRRHPDHYVRGFGEVAALVGSGQLFMDVHGWGFHDELGIRDLPVVLGGLSSDSLLKADKLGESTSGSRATPAQLRAELPPIAPVRDELADAVAERRAAFRHRLAELRPESAAEWERVWPFSMRKHAANVHGNRRLFAAHEAFHCNAVVKVAAAAPVSWKTGRALFHRAMRPFFARTWHVPHARWRYPYFGRAANLALLPGLAAARGVRALATGELRARQGPWPKWSHVADSRAADELRRAHPLLAS
ncbi:MAG TPA: asparagine synthase-related protein, partial [Longimicrobiaceae bacterium]|nr:asparagine synthase-related protein [Longimicrobiaceae bacterium]